MSAIWTNPALQGALGGVSVTALGAFLVRKRTRAEVTSIAATATDTIAHGAATIVTISLERILDLERRLKATEERAQKAHDEAVIARQDEAECKRRVEALEHEVAELRKLIAVPTTTTTTSTTTVALDIPEP